MAALVLFLGGVVSLPAGAQDSPDESIEFLDTIEIIDTVAQEEEREINIPKPDTTTLEPLSGLPLSGLMSVTTPKNPTAPGKSVQLMRDSIADRKGLWQSVRLMSALGAERRISLAALDTSTVVPSKGIPVTTISKTSVVLRDRPEPTLPRDSIADRKRLLKKPRLIKHERPRYPQIARREGWEGTVVLRITIGTGGDAEKVATQTSSGYPALDQSAAESARTWRFDPARDGEFPISTVVDLPVRFDFDEYGIQFSKDEPEPEPEVAKVKTPARRIKSERPPYPKTALQEGWEGTVLLRITVGTGGDAENVTIHESSGFPELDESAAQSAKTWQFDPAKVGDDPVSSVVDLPVRFNIEEYNQQKKTETGTETEQ